MELVNNSIDMIKKGFLGILRLSFLMAFIYYLFLGNSFKGLLLALVFYFIFMSVSGRQGFQIKNTFRTVLDRKWSSLILVFGFITISYLSTILRTRTNIQYIFSNKGALLVPTNSSYIALYNCDRQLDLEILHENKKVKITQLKFKRVNESIIERAKDLFIDKKLLIFEFTLNNEFGLYADVNHNLQPLNSFEAKEGSRANFVLNTSFYSVENEGLNEIVIDKIKYGGVSKSASGFFKVIDGKPYAGPRSIFQTKKAAVTHSCQAFPSVMKDGVVFSYLETLQASWRHKTYRNLIGNKANGNLVCIVSNEGGLVSVNEISQIAKHYGVINATLFDGGSALQYSFDDGEWSCSFSAIANSGYVPGFIKRLLRKRSNSNIPARSPVYLCIH
jgi:hypothetical protein